MNKIRSLLVIALLVSLASCRRVEDKETQEMRSMIAELHQQAVEPLPPNPGDGGRTRKQLYEQHMQQKMHRRAEIIDRFVTMGKPALPILVEALDDNTKYRYVARAAAEAIGKIGDSDSIGALHDLITNGSDLQRQGAIEALGNLRSQSSAGIIEQAMNENSNHAVRLNAVIALGKIEAVSAIGSLAARAADRQENSSVRAYAVQALGNLKATNKISLILQVFEESHKQSPGKMLPEHCHFALVSITGEDIDSYAVSHPEPDELDRCVRAWREWWDNTGKNKYLQN